MQPGLYYDLECLRFIELVDVATAAAAPAFTATTLFAVPQDSVFLVYAMARYSVGGAGVFSVPSILYKGNDLVSLTVGMAGAGASVIDAYDFKGLPFLVPPGSSLVGQLQDTALGAGVTMHYRALFLRLRLPTQATDKTEVYAPARGPGE